VAPEPAVEKPAGIRGVPLINLREKHPGAGEPEQ
jgi:hypothetical protein